MGSSAILRRWIIRSRATGMIGSRRYLCDYNSTGTGMSLDPHKSVPANRGFPWLHKEGGDVVYKFPSLAEDSIINLNRGKSEELPDDDAEIVGYGDGWVALFNRRNNDLFLSHPLSQRCIKLPPIDTLPDPLLNLDFDGHGRVCKVILSSSPDEDECRAMMIFGPAKRLAFCFPGRSSEWVPIGDLFHEDDKALFVMHPRVYEDLVYCSRRKVFTSITSFYDLDYLDDYALWVERPFSYGKEFGEWDIQDPASAKNVRTTELRGPGPGEEDAKGRTRIWLEENKELLTEQCIQIPHLVYAEHSDQLFLVLRFVMLMNPDDAASPLGYIPHCPVKGLTDVFPGKTFGFVVMQMDKKEIMVPGTQYKFDIMNCTIVDELNGMAMFVGVNSFAIPSSSFPQLKSNSIYFSDAKRIRMMNTVNDDDGIFDYESKTISLLRFEFWLEMMQ